jgi:hypothetical protein
VLLQLAAQVAGEITLIRVDLEEAALGFDDEAGYWHG